MIGSLDCGLICFFFIAQGGYSDFGFTTLISKLLRADHNKPNLNLNYFDGISKLFANENLEKYVKRYCEMLWLRSIARSSLL